MPAADGRTDLEKVVRLSADGIEPGGGLREFGSLGGQVEVRPPAFDCGTGQRSYPVATDVDGHFGLGRSHPVHPYPHHMAEFGLLGIAGLAERRAQARSRTTDHTR
jgi:hypothetical protein